MNKNKSYIETLQKKQVEFILKSQEYATLLQNLAKEISKKCNDLTLSEASIASIFELKLFKFISDIFQQEIIPEKEVAIDTERHISKGRIDSKIGAVVIEYKKPAVLKNATKRSKATSQLKEYLQGLLEKQQGVLVGVVTDGVRCQIITWGENLSSEPQYHELDSNDVNTIIKSILLLNETALSPANLIKDFCLPSDNSLVLTLTREFYSILSEHMTKKTEMLFTEWQEIFRLAHDDISKQTAIIERRLALEEVIGKKLTQNIDEYKALYSLQTTYAIIIKIIAYKVISKKMFGKNLMFFADLAVANTDTLRLQLGRLEDGEIFRDYGFGNLLEGDFFSWYAAEKQWDSALGEHIKKIFGVLSKYENNDIIDKYSAIQDLFKDLYLQIMPSKVRHCLGEYYTPAWLADHVVSSALEMLPKQKEWRGLDPCAGSGTFVTVMIRHVISQLSGKSDDIILDNILCRIKAIDLNPLAVLSARINYFINIFPYLKLGKDVEIPVYLGDAAYVPEKIDIDGVACLRYLIKTTQGDIDIEIPQDAVGDTNNFSREMTALEGDIHAQDETAVFTRLINLVPLDQRKKIIENRIRALAKRFVELEKRDWNGIWARIVTNFLTTANIGKFDIIAGNPPWIDWKNLPTGYRSKIISLCISRELFSGDGITGGINLNICALISNVAAQNWLSADGILAFLMPQTILFQKTYDGFRKLIQDDGRRLFFQRIVDWTKAGHPFAPVQQKFLTYYIGHRVQDYSNGIAADFIVKTQGCSLIDYIKENSYIKVADIFSKHSCWLVQSSTDNTSFSYIHDIMDIEKFRLLAGQSEYIGREGIEFYPQEIFLLEHERELPATDNAIGVVNFQNSKSKYRIPQQRHLIEKRFLYPLVKGKNVSRFHISNSGYVVPFPYTQDNMRAPVPFALLRKLAPRLAKYLQAYQSIIDSQTIYNSKIIGKKHNTEFYALARVGSYSFAENFVVFRDNTKWGAAVITTQETPWGEQKMPVFQNHAVSISQDLNGNYISYEEAHYICAILNAPIVGKFILQSSDSRTFKVRPPISIPKFNNCNSVHMKLSQLSILAHKHFDNKEKIAEIDIELDSLYLDILEN